MPALLDGYHTSGSTEYQIPDFTPETLQNLTKHIASSLKSTAAGPRTKPSNANKELGEFAIKTRVSNAAASDGITAKGNQKPISALKSSQAKKRSRDGRIKERSDGTKGKNETSRLQNNKKKNISEIDNKMDEEIRALGGTKEDVALMANLMSGSEIEDEDARPRNESGDGLEKEVLRLVRQFGVDRVSQEEVVASSDSEEGEEVEKLEDIRSSDLTTSFGRDQSSLVSRE